MDLTGLLSRGPSVHDATFDYVIVGAGAAGCVLANRLSADPAVRVLLLEAGGKNNSPLVRIPAGFAKLMGTKYNWKFETAPQRHLNNRRIYLPQGRVLGGSTAINAMLYVRGHRLDYDEWRDLGNPGWGYDDVLPYFKKSERNERLADEYHGTTGPLNVADQVQPNPLSRAFMRAVQETGIPLNPDPNGAQQEGAFYHQVTQKDGWRESAATAFLDPVARRDNLVTLTGARATRIALDGDRARSVEFVRGGSANRVHAEREVILAAGAINTPRLLLLSGIGPAAELEEVAIPVTHDLPGVGKNLHDQLEVYITAACAQPISYSGEDRWHKAVLHAIQWGLYKTGPATATITEGGAFINSSPDVRSPDLQLHFLPAYVVWEDGSHTAADVDGHGVTLLACAVRPKSRGEVTLRSADPTAMPVVDPNYLAEPEDLDVSVEGIRRIREVFAAPAFRPYLRQEHMPGLQVKSDEQIRDYIRAWGKTDYHPVGTCKMGNDELAVVDAQLRVHGIQGLRVIDSSIMPTITSGNTQAPTIMIGEKGAAMILDERP